MAEAVAVPELAEAMYATLRDIAGAKKLSANDLTKMMVDRFGADRCTREACKRAIRELIDSGRCTYTYFGGTYVEIATGTATGA